METTFEKQSPTNGRLKVVIQEIDYKAELDKKIRDYSKKAVIKGFRPGHVPPQLIKKMYGKSLLIDDVINLVSKQVNTYITDNKLKVVGDPIPDDAVSNNIDWEADKEFTFEYEVGLASDFTVDVANLPAINFLEIEPSDESVEEAIADIVNRYGSQEEVEEVEVGDIVFGTLKNAATGFETESGIPTDKVIEASRNIFKGLEKGSSVTFDIQSIFESARELGFATGKSDEEAASLEGEFEFTVSKITRGTKAEINQELFDKALGAGKATNEDEFKAQIKTIIQENYNRESGNLLDFEVDKTLLNSVSIELPDAFLKTWLHKVNEGKFTMEDIEKDYDAFARGLRLDLIKSEIAQASDIKLDYADVLEEAKAEIRNYFGGYAYEGMEEMVDKMAQRTLSENKDNAVNNYTNKAFGRKVLNFIKDNIKVEKKVVKVDEFNEVAKATYAV